MSLTSFFTRLSFTLSDNRRDAGLALPASVTLHADIPYGMDKKYQTLEVLHPADAQGLLPVIVNVHGGGYVYGDTKRYRFYCAELAGKGFAVVSFNYRLAPAHKYPAPLEDLNAVLLWLRAHGEGYHADVRRLFLVGDSAGAQLASQYAAIATNPVYASLVGIEPPPLRISALSLGCGMYDMERKTADVTGVNRLFLDYFGENPKSLGAQLKVLDYVNHQYPPAFLFTFGGDFLREDAAPMAELLQSRGVEAEYHCYGDEKTGHVAHLALRTPLARKVNAAQANFLLKHSGGEE